MALRGFGLCLAGLSYLSAIAPAVHCEPKEGGNAVLLSNMEVHDARQALLQRVRDYFQRPAPPQDMPMVAAPLDWEERSSPRGEVIFKRPLRLRHQLLPFSLKEAQAKSIALAFLDAIGVDESDAELESVLLHQVKDPLGITSIEDAILKVRQKTLGRRVFGPGSTMTLIVGKEGWIHHATVDWIPLRHLRSLPTAESPFLQPGPEGMLLLSQDAFGTYRLTGTSSSYPP